MNRISTNGSDRRSDTEFLQAGKKRLEGDLTREATTDEVSDLRKENARLKEMVADLFLRYDIVKKSLMMLD
jgi:transposase